MSLSLRNSERIQKAIASRKNDFGIVEGVQDDPDVDEIELMRLPFK